MEELTDYDRTIIIYCRDFLDTVAEMPELKGENRALGDLIDFVLESPSTDRSLLLDLEPILGRYYSRLMSIYTRQPESLFINKAIMRVESMRDMCARAAGTRG